MIENNYEIGDSILWKSGILKGQIGLITETNTYKIIKRCNAKEYHWCSIIGTEHDTVRHHISNLIKLSKVGKVLYG